MNTFGVTADSELQATLRTFASQTVERKVRSSFSTKGRSLTAAISSRAGKFETLDGVRNQGTTIMRAGSRSRMCGWPSSQHQRSRL